MTDPQLPTLSTVLNPEAMLGVLSTACLSWPDLYEARSCRIENVRYKPGKSCLIRYDVLLQHRRTSDVVKQIFCGRVYRKDESASRWEKALAAVSGDSPDCQRVTHFPALELIVWCFPNERKLRGIATLLDAEQLRTSVLPAILSGPVLEVETELVRYIPEHGCTARVNARTHTGTVALYGKIQSADLAARSCAILQSLGRDAWFQPRYGILWQREIEGVPAGPGDGPAIARALANLHSRTMPELAAPLRRTPDQVRQLLSTMPEAIAVLDEADRRLVPSPVRATLHGDPHLKNFLIADGEARPIDLDMAHTGDPLEDLGSFSASLYHRSLREGSDGSETERTISEFVAEYERRVTWPVESRAVAAHIARALITERVCRAITRPKGDMMNDLVSVAQRLLARTETPRDVMKRFEAQAKARPGRILDVRYKTFCRPTSQHKSVATVAYEREGKVEVETWGARQETWVLPADPAMPWLATLLDPVAVRAHLPVAAEQVEIDLLNYRPANRVTARFRIRNGQQRTTVYAKTYCDDRGLTVSQRLQALAQKGLLMPEPLGYSPELRTIWQTAFDGEALRDRIGTAEAPALLAVLVQQLRHLHTSGVECPRRMLPDMQWAELRDKTDKLIAVAPQHRRRLETAMSTLRAMLPSLEPVPAEVVHGDFHVRQLMVSGDTVALFDFDEIGWGDPTEDLGHFIADMHGDGFSPGTVASVRADLLSAWREQVEWPMPPNRLRWHTAAQLLTRAYRALLQLKPDFESRLEQHLALAEAEL